MSYEREPSFYNSPVCVCECCGNIVRILLYQSDEVYSCRFCGTEYTRTRYSLSDDEAWLIYYETREAFDFRDGIYAEYVRESKKFDVKCQSERVRLAPRRLII